MVYFVLARFDNLLPDHECLQMAREYTYNCYSEAECPFDWIRQNAIEYQLMIVETTPGKIAMKRDAVIAISNSDHAIMFRLMYPRIESHA